MSLQIAYPLHRDYGAPRDSYLARAGKYGKTLYNPQGMHLALDIPAPAGTALYACVSGTVVKTGRDSKLGYYVVIRNAFGEFWECHMQAPALVKVNQVVTRHRTQVGKVGATGNTNGPHVHMIWYLGRQLGKSWGSIPFGNPFPFVLADFKRRFR